MILIGILCIIALVIGALGLVFEKPKCLEAKADVFSKWFATAAFILFLFYAFSQFALAVINTKREEVTYRQNLVSLQDGKGLSGTISGGVFIMRGQVNDTQYFSYYVRNDDGSYRLDKRDATKSTIWQDATPKTAYVDITDAVHNCKTTWYSTWCLIEAPEFVRADFHIPPESIQEDFQLDAQ